MCKSRGKSWGKSWGKLMTYGIPLCLFLAIAFVLFQWFRPSTTIRIGKSTTVITTPIGSNGLPDYQAELRDREGGNCPLGDNGAAEFWDAMGQGEHDREWWDAMCRYLKIPIVDETPRIQDSMASFDISLQRWMLQQGIQIDPDNEWAWTPMYVLPQLPWKSTECPPAARFLSEHKKHLDLLIASTEKAGFYSPGERALGLPDDSGIDTNFFMTIAQAIEILQLRAANRIAKGELSEAWGDLYGAMKIATKAKENFVGFLIMSGRTREPRMLLNHLLIHKDVDQQLIDKIALDLAAFPSPTAKVKSCVYAERLFSIGMWIQLSESPDPFSAEGFRNGLELGHLYDGAVDWNILLERANELFDKMDTAAAGPIHAVRQNNINILYALKLDHEKHVGDRASKTMGYLSMRKRSQLIAEETGILALDAFFMVMDSYERSLADRELLQAQLALAEFRLENGSYPDALDELAPESVDFVDTFTSNLPRYRKVKGGYLLYSVGPNQVDDEGSGGLMFRGISLEGIEDDTDPKEVEDFLRLHGEVDCIRADRDYSNLFSSDFNADDISIRLTEPSTTFTEILKRRISAAK